MVSHEIFWWGCFARLAAAPKGNCPHPPLSVTPLGDRAFHTLHWRYELWSQPALPRGSPLHATSSCAPANISQTRSTALRRSRGHRRQLLIWSVCDACSVFVPLINWHSHDVFINRQRPDTSYHNYHIRNLYCARWTWTKSQPNAPAPESSKQRGGGKKSFRGHMASFEAEAPKAWSSRRRRRRWGGELGERFYCFLRVSECLSLQRLLKINVVHRRPLVEKNGFAQWVGSEFWFIEATEATASVIFLQFLRWQVDKNRFREKFCSLSVIFIYKSLFSDTRLQVQI